MKTMTCTQLGGPDSCDKEFNAESFEKMAKLSKEHAMEMAKSGDIHHLKAMEKMREMMNNDPDGLKEWMEEKEKEFETLPEEK